MIYQLSIPKAVPDVDEVRVLEWHGRPGHRIEAGMLVVELETHKAVFEVRAAQSAVLRAILTPEGSWRELGLPLAILSDTADEPLPANAADWATLPVEFEIT